MTRAELFDRLQKLKPWFASRGIVELSVFGSFARNEARPDSDIDLLVRFDPVPGFAFFAIERGLAAWLGRPVELCTR